MQTLSPVNLLAVRRQIYVMFLSFGIVVLFFTSRESGQVMIGRLLKIADNSYLCIFRKWETQFELWAFTDVFW